MVAIVSSEIEIEIETVISIVFRARWRKIHLIFIVPIEIETVSSTVFRVRWRGIRMVAIVSRFRCLVSGRSVVHPYPSGSVVFLIIITIHLCLV